MGRNNITLCRPCRDSVMKLIERIYIYDIWQYLSIHDDVIKWEHFPRCWPSVRGIHRSPVNSPHKGQWRGALMLSLICAWINGRVNNGDAGDLRRHLAHYDVTLMVMYTYVIKWMNTWLYIFIYDYIRIYIYMHIDMWIPTNSWKRRVVWTQHCGYWHRGAKAPDHQCP